MLGKSGRGQVYLGRRVTGGSGCIEPDAIEVGLKFEHQSSAGCINGSPYEWKIYHAVNGCYGLPCVHYKGRQGDYFIMVMDLLEPSLWQVWASAGQSMSPNMVACIVVEAISILEKLHLKGFIHADVKPKNILLGQPGTPDAKKLFLADLGLSARWKDASSGRHFDYDQRGIRVFASVHAHLGRTLSGRDDLQSLAYTLISLLKGGLPWEGHHGVKRNFFICRDKMATCQELLCCIRPAPFKELYKSVTNMKFDEEPNYMKLISLFESLVDPCEQFRPIKIDKAVKVGQKRGRQLVIVEDDGMPRKKVCLGSPSCLWISVYDACKPMQ